MKQFRVTAGMLQEFARPGRVHETKSHEAPRRVPAGRHVMFYVFEDDAPRSVRILHRSMDFDRYP